MYQKSPCSTSQRIVAGSCVEHPQNINRLPTFEILYCKGKLVIVQELCESRGGRPGLSVLTSLLVSVEVKNY